MCNFKRRILNHHCQRTVLLHETGTGEPPHTTWKGDMNNTTNYLHKHTLFQMIPVFLQRNRIFYEQLNANNYYKQLFTIFNETNDIIPVWTIWQWYGNLWTCDTHTHYNIHTAFLKHLLVYMYSITRQAYMQ